IVVETDPIQQSFEPWQVVADANGEFDTSWYIFDAEFEGATFLATATGESSQLTASATFTDAALIRVYVAPTYSTQSTAQTFSVVVQNVSNDTLVRYISVDLPDDFSAVSVAATSFSAGTWGTPSVGAGNVITVATTDNTAGNALGQNGWFRFDINATTSITAHTATNDA